MPALRAQELSAPTAVVKRDGKWSELPVKELVLGDIVGLKGGDVIPADCRVIDASEAATGTAVASMSQAGITQAINVRVPS